MANRESPMSSDFSDFSNWVGGVVPRDNSELLNVLDSVAHLKGGPTGAIDPMTGAPITISGEYDVERAKNERRIEELEAEVQRLNDRMNMILPEGESMQDDYDKMVAAEAEFLKLKAIMESEKSEHEKRVDAVMGDD